MTRGSGILLAVSSLPSEYGIGTLGEAAYRFVDFLVDLKQKYWQVLPIGPTSYGDSPYQSLSVFSGNPYLIDLDTLVWQGLLTPEEIRYYNWGTKESAIDYAALFRNRCQVLRKAFSRFDEQDSNYIDFVAEHGDWVEDYGFYMALKENFDYQSWQSWPEEIRKNNRLLLQNTEKSCIMISDFGCFANTSFGHSGKSFVNMPMQREYRL